MGGKRRLAKHILPLMGEHTTYVEPFAGGAAMFFMKEPSKVEVINDINSDLVNLYRVVRHHLDELVRHFRWALISREDFLNAKKVDPSTLTDVQRAARFYYLQRQAFGAKIEGRTFGTSPSTPPKFNLLRIEEDLSQAHLRLARTYIENLPWDKCIEKYDRPGTLFYLDPPYWATEGYDVEFGFEQYERMAELAKTIEGQMIISVNDIKEMRRVFNGLDIDTVKLRHTVGGRGGIDREELLIRSW
jgi:DNA adenine methylase